MFYSKLASIMLERANWQQMLKNSEKDAVKLWNKTGNRLCWIPKQEFQQVKTIEEFKEVVPISSKKMIFRQNSLKKLTLNRLRKIRFVMMSSGSSSSFSTGVFTRKEMNNAAFNTDLFLNLFFKARKVHTLIINASSMGVKVFTNHVVSDTGPRTDIVIGILKSVACYYQKVFIIGDPIFIKLMVEEAIAEGVNWDDFNAFFISGGEWLPESLRSYIHGISGKSPSVPEKGFWVGTYGLTEIGYPLFFENSELAAYRSEKQPAFSSIDIHSQLPRFTTPFYFFFRADAYFLEEIKQKSGLPQMAFTPLNKKRLIPIFRYNTGDLGEIEREQLPISFQPFPVVKFWGRDKNYIDFEEQRIHISDLKEILFKDFELNPIITGFFTVEKNTTGISLKIQLKKGHEPEQINLSALQRNFASLYPNLITLNACRYYDMDCQMELDFERKFKHIN